MTNPLFKQYHQENLRHLEADTTLAAKAAGAVTVFLSAGITALTPISFWQVSPTTQFMQLFTAGLMLFALLFCLLFLTGYGRYLSTRAFLTVTEIFWQHLHSLKRTPLSHWQAAINAANLATWAVMIRYRHLIHLLTRCIPHRQPKSNKPFLLFQQAPLLLAP